MDRKKLIKTLITLFFFIFIVHILANKFYWYYSIWYFDMPMHFLGGFWSGLFLIWFFSYYNLLGQPLLKLILKIMLGALLIGIAWEIFEFAINTYYAREVFVANGVDSVSDIFFDLAGGATAILYYLKKIMHVKENGVQLN